MMQALRADACQKRGGDRVISKGPSAKRTTLRDWQSAGGSHLGIVLDDTPAPATPQSGALFFTGDQRAKLIGIETWLDLCAASARDHADDWSETSRTTDGMLAGRMGRDSLVDDPPRTSILIAAYGHRVAFAGLFGFKFWAFEDQKRCQRWRWRRADAQVGRRPSLRPFTHAMRDARRSGALATRRQTEVLR